MTTREEALAYGLSFKNTYQQAPFHDKNWQLVRVKGSKKAFLWTYEKDGYVNLNVKVSSEWRDFWRNLYKSVKPGYHQNKMNWNTIVLDGSVPEEDIKMMIAESYDLIANRPTDRIYEIVKQIPKGTVATYSQVARLAGNERMCRTVGNALRKVPFSETMPCHRVVNSKGELSGAISFGGKDTQQKLLEAEGVEVRKGRVDLKKYGWEVDERQETEKNEEINA